MCAVINAEVFRECALYDHPVFITCPPDHVISIRSAEIGLSVNRPDSNGRQCILANSTCRLSTVELGTSCNDSQWCIVNHFDDWQCGENFNWDTIRVTYNCIKGK